jgi:bis(5'-nucleosidyl)-tetraphosphatase
MKKEHSGGIIVYTESLVHGHSEPMYLLLNYRKGHWGFPKGKLEGNETYLQAAERELKEETNLEAEVHPGFEQSIMYFFKNQQGELIEKDVTFFVAKAKGRNVILSPEHLYYKWLPFKEALRELTYSNTKQILSLADQFIRSLPKH